MVAFIEAFRDQFGVEPICRALPQAGVRISPSGYYAARARPPPARAVREAALEKQILRVYKDSGERYGAWKVWDQLNREGIAAARCTVERLMRRLGLRGVRRGGWKKPRTTVPDPSQDRPADLVNRGFAPDAPNRLWVVDFTFVSTRAGTAYTAFVIDAFSRLITGWRTAAHHSTDLVLDALVMAVTYRARQGVKVAGLIHHSDAGSEYLSIRYGAELAASGIAPSVGTVGDSYDNALAESIIGLYKTEVTGHLGPWETPAQVEAATSEWASWYNTARVMRRTGGRPPGEYEQAWRDGTLGQVPARGPGSRPRRPPGTGAEGGGDGRRSLPRRAPPAPAGAPPRTPALLRDAPAGHHGCGAGRVSPRRPRDGCHGTPAQVKGASGVAGDDAEASPLTSPGNPRRKTGVPDEEIPSPLGASWPGGARHQASRWTAQLDRCSIKQKRKNDQTVVPPGGGTVEDNSHPDESIWGESSLHQTRGAPTGLWPARCGGVLAFSWTFPLCCFWCPIVKLALVIRWAYLAEPTLFPDAIVISLDVVEHGAPDFARVAPHVLIDQLLLDRRIERFRCRVVVAYAGVPDRRDNTSAKRRSRYLPEVYWEPRSWCTTSPPMTIPGPRAASALSTASSTRPVRMWSSTAQPTTLFEHMSISVARYAKPEYVQI